jgi:NAD(P)-dependent dehydrogenase (short-subunit alcohol dehydrogenase family)
MKPLLGKIALVTGASRGIGKGIALCLGEAGAKVYITGRTVDEGKSASRLAGTINQTAEEIVKLGGECTAIQCDHRIDSEVESVFKRIEAENQKLNILVNNVWGVTNILLTVLSFGMKKNFGPYPLLAGILCFSQGLEHIMYPVCLLHRF